MIPITVFSPAEVENQVNPAPLSNFDLQFLAQGDSWFSLGALPPSLTTNLFDGMGTTAIAACVVNCAEPGAELSQMVQTTRDAEFLGYLNGKKSRPWIGIFLSAGGNDLILAATEPPTNTQDLRLFLTPAEWTNAPGAEKYLSNAGWQTFCTHLSQVLNEFLVARDSGENKGVPVVMHTYDITCPHNKGAGLDIGPWLYPQMLAYGVPQSDWHALGQVLLGRLGTLLDHLAANVPDGSVHIIHSQGTLTPALPTDTAATADWENEIHPTSQGYRQLSALWLPLLDALFASRIQVAAAPDNPLPLAA